MYDVIVVGARCAGAATALLLAKAGRRVLVLDRGQVSADVVSTHLLRPPAVSLLDDWGLLDRLAATGCPPIRTESLTTPGARLACDLAAVHGSISYAPRRPVLDTLLLDAAIEAGAEFRQVAVTGLVQDEGRVTGVRCRDEELTAHLVVGADGMRSTVAGLVGAAEYDVRPTASCCYYSYWTGLPADGLEGFISDGVGVGVIPTHDGRTLVSTYFPQDDFARIRTDAQQSYLDGIRRCHPSLGDRLAGATQVDKLHAMGDQRNFFRRPVGPGWVLVGDAGHHKDSITAWGMTHAFDQADVVVRLLNKIDLADPAAVDGVLESFAATRDESLTGLYEITLDTARLDPAEVTAVLAAAAGDESITTRVFRFLAGRIGQEELFTADLLERMAG